MERKVAVKVNETLFVHGGLSGFYCQNSLESLTDKARERLGAYDPAAPGILEDAFGPFWYRGLSGGEPPAPMETVEAILAHHQARHIVVGHTPTMGVIWPRYDARVIQADTGISDYYGGYVGYLEITSEGLFAGYAWGKLPLPEKDSEAVDYLRQVIARDPDNARLQQRLDDLLQPPEEPAAEDEESAEEPEDGVEEPGRLPPICDISL